MNKNQCSKCGYLIIVFGGKRPDTCPKCGEEFKEEQEDATKTN